MEAAILIGNGLNRCYKGAIPWGMLLQDIADEYGVSFNHNNPFPLEFESITNQILSKEKAPSDAVYKKLKQKISRIVNEQKPEANSLHVLFTNELPVNHILTTNYDYMLEYSYSAVWTSYQLQKDAAETKYSIYRQANIGQKRFYHIHGESRYPTTLCLGYEHYAGYLSKMREYLKAAPNIPQKINKVQLPEKESWLNLFFTHDIYIVGLTLDSCEIDLWWLLTYRAYLYYSNDSGLRSLMKNKITIFYTDCNRNKARENLFRNLHVECRPVAFVDQNYCIAYQTIHTKIKNSINKRMYERNL